MDIEYDAVCVLHLDVPGGTLQTRLIHNASPLYVSQDHRLTLRSPKPNITLSSNYNKRGIDFIKLAAVAV